MVCHHLVRFGNHRYCSNSEMFLVFHVIKRDHVTIKAIITIGSLKVSHHPTIFGGYRLGTGGVEI